MLKNVINAEGPLERDWIVNFIPSATGSGRSAHKSTENLKSHHIYTPNSSSFSLELLSAHVLVNTCSNECYYLVLLQAPKLTSDKIELVT